MTVNYIRSPEHIHLISGCMSTLVSFSLFLYSLLLPASGIQDSSVSISSTLLFLDPCVSYMAYFVFKGFCNKYN